MFSHGYLCDTVRIRRILQNKKSQTADRPFRQQAPQERQVEHHLRSSSTEGVQLQPGLLRQRVIIIEIKLKQELPVIGTARWGTESILTKISICDNIHDPMGNLHNIFRC
jgi:hypothetical protein